MKDGKKPLKNRWMERQMVSNSKVGNIGFINDTTAPAPLANTTLCHIAAPPGG